MEWWGAEPRMQQVEEAGTEVVLVMFKSMDKMSKKLKANLESKGREIISG